MATVRQKRLARAIVKNSIADKPLNKQELVESVGYTETSGKKKSSEILESKGVVQELELMGFTEANAKSVVQEILLDKESDKHSRLKAADMVFKVEGTYAAEKHINVNINHESTERTQGLADRLNGLLRR